MFKGENAKKNRMFSKNCKNTIFFQDIRRSIYFGQNMQKYAFMTKYAKNVHSPMHTNMHLHILPSLKRSDC